LSKHTNLQRLTGYSGFASGSIVLQLNRTETTEQKYVIVCDDQKKYDVESLKWNGRVRELLI